MSEEPTAMTAQPATSGQQTAGQLLRAAREATGLHIAALAVAMKVPVKKLEALEADRLDELPDAVFVRALASSMCRALKTDPAEVLSRLPQSTVPQFQRDDRGINMPYRAPEFHDSSALKALVTKPAFLLVLGLLAAALAVLLVPEVRKTPSDGDMAPTPPVAMPPPAPAETTAHVVAEVAKAALPNSSLVPPAVLPATPATSAAPAVSQSVASASERMASAPAATASAPRAVAGPEVIGFKVKSSTWVRVTDAKGVVQFEKTLAAGEAASVAGSAPFSVVIGNAGATEVSVRGQPFALDAYAKDNVARFEVK